MRLSYNVSSPYVRRITLLIAWMGLGEKIRNVESIPYTDASLRDRNPGGMVPSLELEDGTHIYDSLTIGYFLDQQFGTGSVMQAFTSGDLPRLTAYAEIESLQVALVKLRQDQMRGENRPHDWYIDRFRDTAVATTRSLSGKVALFDQRDFISASLIAALGMMEFRFADIPWRETAPELAKWYDAHEAEPLVHASFPQNI